MVRIALSLAVLVLAAGEASAQSSAARRAAKELVEYLRTRFVREVAEEGVEKLEARFARVIDSFGDDAVKAARTLGPRLALDTVQRHGAAGIRILAKYGDKGARLLNTNPRGALQVMSSLGDEGIELMIRRHGEITAARLPDLAAQIGACGRPRDVLAVLERYGDRACAFLWKNKGVIFTSAALAAFLANPRPFLEGVRDIGKEVVGAPIGAIAAATDWTAVFLVATLLAAGLAAFRMLILRRPAPTPPSGGTSV
ncbi:MAG TPA: hypothetical protein VJU16_08460 [Planctomycetota bacterium]|nr:hypothetical protein [Planctomycetota bacterium]